MSLLNLLRWLPIVVLVCAVSAPDALAQGTGRIRGQVLNDETDEPIAGVTVFAELPGANRPSLETTTDDRGEFQVTGLSSGRWTTIFTKEGFQTWSGGGAVSQGAARPITIRMLRQRTQLELAFGDEAFEGLDPVQLQADLVAADAAYSAQQWDTAIVGYAAVLAVLPQMSDLHMQLGNAYRGQGDLEAALAAYERKLAAEPGHLRARTEIASTRLAMGDLDAAAELAELTDASASPEDLYNLGELDFANGNVDSAADWYTKATAAAPTWEKPWFKLALVALNQGDIETAKQHFQKVVEVAPDSEEGTQAQATLSALP